MKPGGSLILTFPHLRSYFAGDDRFVNHLRRYKLAEMITNLATAGLKTVEIQKVLGPLEKITMLTVISLIPLFDRFRKGIQNDERGQGVVSAGFLVTLFGWLNRLYCVPVWRRDAWRRFSSSVRSSSPDRKNPNIPQNHFMVFPLPFFTCFWYSLSMNKEQRYPCGKVYLRVGNDCRICR
jgi:hypothetical protein